MPPVPEPDKSFVPRATKLDSTSDEPQIIEGPVEGEIVVDVDLDDDFLISKSVKEDIFSTSLWLDEDQLCDKYSQKVSHRHFENWVKSGLILRIFSGNTAYYPLYAFDTRVLIPSAKFVDVVGAFKSQKSMIKIAAWMISHNSWLDDETPLSVLESNPEAVYEAIRAEVEALEHG